ncbi:unnamed protein product [Moneuplotes crassus]|uniref:Uncharacterized protein n=1 Tax=Euplotes crassus TaxID=5936 RepID=A0AAD2CZ39_EUPCR|nr:unnamed protein product [Moneuplotes crassus]
MQYNQDIDNVMNVKKFSKLDKFQPKIKIPVKFLYKMPFLDGDKEERRTVLEKPIFENSVLSKSVPELKKKEDDQKKRTFILPKIGNKNFIPNSEFQHLEDKKMKRLAKIRDFHSRKKDPQRKSQLLGSHTERSEVNLDHSLESIDSDNFGIRSLIANDQKKKKHFLSVDSLAKRVRENNKKYISRNKDILGLPKISKSKLSI